VQICQQLEGALRADERFESLMLERRDELMNTFKFQQKLQKNDERTEELQEDKKSELIN
jgi:hypothetical protein